MIQPIRLRAPAPIETARRTLVKAGYGADLKRAHTTRVMREARANVAKARHREQVERRAAILAAKAMAPVRDTYAALDELDASDVERQLQRSARDQMLTNLEHVMRRGRR